MIWNFDLPILIQGIPPFQTLKNITQIEPSNSDLVAIVSAGSQTTADEAIPVFDLVEDAIKAVGQIKTSLIFVPAYHLDRVV